jgi:hypothetical protein
MCCDFNFTFSIGSRISSGAAVVGYVALLSGRYFAFHTSHLEWEEVGWTDIENICCQIYEHMTKKKIVLKSYTK